LFKLFFLCILKSKVAHAYLLNNVTTIEGEGMKKNHKKSTPHKAAHET
jgi:hypothetical protein